MEKTIRLKFPTGEYHTALVSKFVSSSNRERSVLSIWYKDLTEIEKTGVEMGSFTLLRENENKTYTHLYCGDDYDAIYKELSPYILKGEYKDLPVESLPNTIDYVEEYNYFSDKSENNNIIKINKLDEYLIYKYKTTIDLNEYNALSFTNITNSFLNDIEKIEIKEVECINDYMFFELKNSEVVFVEDNKNMPSVDCMERAIHRKMKMITPHKIFNPE